MKSFKSIAMNSNYEREHREFSRSKAKQYSLLKMDKSCVKSCAESVLNQTPTGTKVKNLINSQANDLFC
jgi:hypothetical protein